MDIIAIINELRKELERIDGLIVALESLQAGRRRGRPPKALQQLRAGSADHDTPAARQAAKVVRKAASKAAKKKTRKKTVRKQSPSEESVETQEASLLSDS